MKKLLALLLILCCAVTLFACDMGGDTEDPNKDKNKDQDPPKVDLVAPFITAISNTDPVEQTITVSRENVLCCTLNGEYHIVYDDQGNATINYSYDKLNEITSGSDEMMSVVTGTVTVDKNGHFTGDKEGDVSSVASIALNLESVKNDCVVEGNVLSLTVKAADTASVLGVAFSSDVSLVLTIAQEIVSSFSLAYTDNNAKVNIGCQYQ